MLYRESFFNYTGNISELTNTEERPTQNNYLNTSTACYYSNYYKVCNINIVYIAQEFRQKYFARYVDSVG